VASCRSPLGTVTNPDSEDDIGYPRDRHVKRCQVLDGEGQQHRALSRATPCVGRGGATAACVELGGGAHRGMQGEARARWG
jgi:hypothetical protein